MLTIEASLRQKLMTAFAPVELQILNQSENHRGHLHLPEEAHGETHFFVKVVSEVFISLSRVERHRRVQGLLEEERTRGLHALSLSLLTPEENLVAGNPQGKND
ncbi:MAG: BolA family protein [Bdellovibrio sp.]